MAQRDTSKIGAPLEINGNYYNTLDIEAFFPDDEGSVLLL